MFVMPALISRQAWLQPWQSRPGLVGVALALLIAVGSAIATKPQTFRLIRQAIDVTATPIVSFSPADPDRTRFGRLAWRGGLVLTAKARMLGGYSGLAVSGDGTQITAISDAGTWLTATLGYRNGRPSAVAHSMAGPLQGSNGTSVENRGRDAEGLAIIKAGTQALISYERHIRIMRHALTPDGVGPAIGTIPIPARARMLPANGSLESVAVLAGPTNKDAIVFFAERRRDAAGYQIGWLLPAGNRATVGTAIDLRLKRHRAFDLTDLAASPDGGLIVLWRSWSLIDGVRMRLERLTAEQLATASATGTPMTGELLFEADSRYEIDNMEGVAVSRDQAGNTVLTLISDNNFSWLQRTILLQFTLDNDERTAQP
jgi:hypothetical protein